MVMLQDPEALSCLDHRNETVAYYCGDCERCVCVLCTLDSAQPGQPHHRHDIIDFNAAVARYLHCAPPKKQDTKLLPDNFAEY